MTRKITQNGKNKKKYLGVVINQRKNEYNQKWRINIMMHKYDKNLKKKKKERELIFI